jgi:hypothetical protein
MNNGKNHKLEKNQADEKKIMALLLIVEIEPSA